jgi:predicted nucleotidyltransferase
MADPAPAAAFDAEATCIALDAALRRAGLSWERIRETASEAVLFGSRASGVTNEDSDWDLLLVGEGRPVHTREIDLIWITAPRLQTQEWLGCELASHIAAYGRWLLGSGEWRDRVHVSPDAAARKKAALEVQLNELARNWPNLLPGARDRHTQRLRRDVQRLELLRRRLAVPPTHELDVAWTTSGIAECDPFTLLAVVAAA